MRKLRGEIYRQRYPKERNRSEQDGGTQETGHHNRKHINKKEGRREETTGGKEAITVARKDRPRRGRTRRGTQQYQRPVT